MTLRSHLDVDGESVSEFYDWQAFYFPEQYPTVRVTADPREVREHRIESMRDAIAAWEDERR